MVPWCHGAMEPPGSQIILPVHKLSSRYTNYPWYIGQYTKDNLCSIISPPPDWLGNDTIQMVQLSAIHNTAFLTIVDIQNET